MRKCKEMATQPHVTIMMRVNPSSIMASVPLRLPLVHNSTPAGLVTLLMMFVSSR